MEMSAYLIGFYLSRASWAMKQHVDKLLKQDGLGEVSMGFIGVLLELYRADGQTISELGEAVSLEKSTMTGLVDRMVKATIVTREPDPADRRVQRVWLTDRGKEVQKEVSEVLNASFHELTKGIAEVDIEKVVKLLSRIIDNAKQAKGQ